MALPDIPATLGAATLLLLGWYAVVAPTLRWIRLFAIRRQVCEFEATAAPLEPRALADAAARLAALRELRSGLVTTAVAARIPCPTKPATADARTSLEAVRAALASPGVGALMAGVDGAVPVGWALAARVDLGALLHAAEHFDLADLKSLGELVLAAHEHGAEGALAHLAPAMGEGVKHFMGEGLAGHGWHVADAVAHAAPHGALAVEELGHAVGHAAGHVGLGDVHGHVPWITMISAAVQEASLLAEEKTTVERALAHVAVTTGAVAAGGTLGAKGGAALGTVILPGLGTVLGGFLGGVAGAVVGKLTAGEIKAIPLRNALASYERQHVGATAALDASACQIVERTRVAASTEQHSYAETARRFSVEVARLRYEAAVSEALVALLAAREDARADTRLVEERLLGELPCDPGWVWWFGLGTNRAAAGLARRATEAARRRERALAPVGVDPSDPNAAAAVAAIPWPAACAGAIAVAGDAIRSTVGQATSRISESAGVLARSFAESTRRVVAGVTAGVAGHRDLSTKWRAVLAREASEVARHRAALGG